MENPTPTTATTWPVAGLLLEALTNRDFDALQELLADDVRFRGLIPPGPFELNSAGAMTDRLRSWFGGEDDFEVLDASIGQQGTKAYLRWRVQLTPPGCPQQARVAEQHLYLTGTQRVHSVDLLCSGLQPVSG